jgi:hypothetical protein
MHPAHSKSATLLGLSPHPAAVHLTSARIAINQSRINEDQTASRCFSGASCQPRDVQSTFLFGFNYAKFPPLILRVWRRSAALFSPKYTKSATRLFPLEEIKICGGGNVKWPDVSPHRHNKTERRFKTRVSAPEFRRGVFHKHFIRHLLTSAFKCVLLDGAGQNKNKWCVSYI